MCVYIHICIDIYVVCNSSVTCSCPFMLPKPSVACLCYFIHVANTFEI